MSFQRGVIPKKLRIKCTTLCNLLLFRNPSQSHRNMRFLAYARNDRRCSTLRCDVIFRDNIPKNLLPNSVLCMRSLTCVREDSNVILKGFALKNLSQNVTTLCRSHFEAWSIEESQPIESRRFLIFIRNDIVVILTTVGRKNLQQNNTRFNQADFLRYSAK